MPVFGAIRTYTLSCVAAICAGQSRVHTGATEMNAHAPYVQRTTAHGQQCLSGDDSPLGAQIAQQQCRDGQPEKVSGSVFASQMRFLCLQPNAARLTLMEAPSALHAQSAVVS
jgi:hypothetical protein